MSVDESITCRDVVELLSDYLEEALPSSERARVEGHLAECDGCSMVLDELRESIRLTGTLSEEQLSEEQRTTLLGAFRGWLSD